MDYNQEYNSFVDKDYLEKQFKLYTKYLVDNFQTVKIKALTEEEYETLEDKEEDVLYLIIEG